jgi:hypothetical protein
MILNLALMEIKIDSQMILKFLHVLSWIIFIGLCIEAGGVIFNTIFTHFINPDASKYFWKEIDLSNLYQFDAGYFTVVSTIICIVLIMKVVMFYLIIKLFYEKKIDLAQPFNTDLRKCILNVAYLALGIGLFSFWGIKYSKWIETKSVSMPNVYDLRFSGADVWLFMCVILFVIAQIMKRGVELQEENDLTI